MKYLMLPIVLGFIPFTLKSQFIEDFSSGHLSSWKGDTAHFIINPEGQLQLNATSGISNSWIYTEPGFQDSMTWELYLKLDFAPSTTNQLRIYLGLTSPDISSATGYFLEIGASGDVDAIDLKYLSGGVSTTVASSAQGLVADEPVELRLRINKHNPGNWDVFEVSGPLPQLLFTADHDAIPLTALNTFGFNLKYTDTRRNKFFFDDISIEPIEADVTAPVFQSLQVIDHNTVVLHFDELLNETLAANAGNYLLTPGNVVPSNIETGGNEIILTWAESFVSQQLYSLQFSGIADLTGNIIASQNTSFTYTQIDDALAFDILLTEVMADPTPVIGLPDGEFIELFNNSSRTFDLSDYTLNVGSSERELPESIFGPGEYIILTDENVADGYALHGRVVVVDNFPSLTNSGTTISIINQNDETIHSISYTLDWYHDAEKSQGGWSLEMKNPFHICATAENWKASDHLSGGTPGKQNSVWEVARDIEGPDLLSVFTGNAATIELRFSEHIDEILMTDPALYSITPQIGVSGIDIINPLTVRINLSMPLQEGLIYSLMPFEAFDCLGNSKIISDTVVFGLVTGAAMGDILINEILFNPGTGGSRFIELINVSDKFIDLSTLALGRISSSQQDIFAIGINEIINPHSIVALAPSPADILSRFIVPFPERLYEASLPSWDEDSDHAAILSGGVIIDSFTYSSDWHHPAISDQNGVSLERISTMESTSNSFNWHSASSLQGNATPTGPNSQSKVIVNGIPPFLISNKTFSPDGDGFKDFIQINFELESGNDVGSIWVYDLEGREIHQILSNETIGNSAFVTWDGRNAEGLLADAGIYLIFIQLWDPQGNVRQFQESCALIKR